jgi:hypothetical protein
MSVETYGVADITVMVILDRSWVTSQGYIRECCMDSIAFLGLVSSSLR